MIKLSVRGTLNYRKDVLQIHISYNLFDNIEGNVMLAFSYKWKILSLTIFQNILFICWFTFHPYRDVTSKFDLCLELSEAFFSVAHLQWSMVISEICETRTCCRALVSGTVTTYFNDLGLARLGIESRSPAFEANAIPLSHRGGSLIFKIEPSLRAIMFS